MALLNYEAMLLSDKQSQALSSVRKVRRIVKEFLHGHFEGQRVKNCPNARAVVALLEDLEPSLEEIFRETIH